MYVSHKSLLALLISTGAHTVYQTIEYIIHPHIIKTNGKIICLVFKRISNIDATRLLKLCCAYSNLNYPTDQTINSGLS